MTVSEISVIRLANTDAMTVIIIPFHGVICIFVALLDVL